MPFKLVPTHQRTNSFNHLPVRWCVFHILHPDNGLPIYALGGTFFETYISPMYGISFDKVEWKPDISIQKTPFNNAWQELNDQQRIKIRKIIKLSLSNRFGFNELVE